MKTDEGLKG